MKCEKCNGKSLVLDTRHSENGDYTMRLFECTECKNRFHTLEYIIDDDEMNMEDWKNLYKFRRKTCDKNIRN